MDSTNSAISQLPKELVASFLKEALLSGAGQWEVLRHVSRSFRHAVDISQHLTSPPPAWPGLAWVPPKSLVNHSPLLTAAQQAHLDLVKWAIRHGCPVSSEALAQACAAGSKEVTLVLATEMTTGLNVGATPWTWGTFFNACKSGNVELIDYLLSNYDSIHLTMGRSSSMEQQAGYSVVSGGLASLRWFENGGLLKLRAAMQHVHGAVEGSNWEARYPPQPNQRRSLYSAKFFYSILRIAIDHRQFELAHYFLERFPVSSMQCRWLNYETCRKLVLHGDVRLVNCIFFRRPLSEAPRLPSPDASLQELDKMHKVKRWKGAWDGRIRFLELAIEESHQIGSPSDTLLRWAVSNGFAHKKGIVPSHLVAAIKARRHDMFDFLLNERRCPLDSAVLAAAIRANDPHFIEPLKPYLLRHSDKSRALQVSFDCLSAAMESKNPDLLRFVHSLVKPTLPAHSSARFGHAVLMLLTETDDPVMRDALVALFPAFNCPSLEELLTAKGFPKLAQCLVENARLAWRILREPPAAFNLISRTMQFQLLTREAILSDNTLVIGELERRYGINFSLDHVDSNDALGPRVLHLLVSRYRALSPGTCSFLRSGSDFLTGSSGVADERISYLDSNPALFERFYTAIKTARIDRVCYFLATVFDPATLSARLPAIMLRIKTNRTHIPWTREFVAFCKRRFEAWPDLVATLEKSWFTSDDSQRRLVAADYGALDWALKQGYIALDELAKVKPVGALALKHRNFASTHPLYRKIKDYSLKTSQEPENKAV